MSKKRSSIQGESIEDVLRRLEQQNMMSSAVDPMYAGYSSNIQSQPRQEFTNEITRFSDPNLGQYHRRFNTGDTIVSAALSDNRSPFLAMPINKGQGYGLPAREGFNFEDISIDGDLQNAALAKNKLYDDVNEYRNLAMKMQASGMPAYSNDPELRPYYEKLNELKTNIERQVSFLKEGSKMFSKTQAERYAGNIYDNPLYNADQAMTSEDVLGYRSTAVDEMSKSAQMVTYNDPKQYKEARDLWERNMGLFQKDLDYLSSAVRQARTPEEKQRITNKMREIQNSMMLYRTKEPNYNPKDMESLALQRRKFDFEKEKAAKDINYSDIYSSLFNLGKGISRETWKDVGGEFNDANLKGKKVKIGDKVYNIQDIRKDENGEFTGTLVGSHQKIKEGFGEKLETPILKDYKFGKANSLVEAIVEGEGGNLQDLRKWERENNLTDMGGQVSEEAYFKPVLNTYFNSNTSGSPDIDFAKTVIPKGSRIFDKNNVNIEKFNKFKGEFEDAINTVRSFDKDSSERKIFEDKITNKLNQLKDKSSISLLGQDVEKIPSAWYTPWQDSKFKIKGDDTVYSLEDLKTKMFELTNPKQSYTEFSSSSGQAITRASKDMRNKLIDIDEKYGTGIANAFAKVLMEAKAKGESISDEDAIIEVFNRMNNSLVKFEGQNAPSIYKPVKVYNRK